MKLTVLVDNNTYIDQYYCGEPAVSYYLEDADTKILFDTGYSDLLIHNAQKMGIDLEKLNSIVISHGHNDHTRGLHYLLNRYNLSKTNIIAHPDAFNEKHQDNLSIGSPISIEKLREQSQLQLSKTPVQMTNSIYFLGEIPEYNHFENRMPLGKTKKNGTTVDDYVLDDSALAYQSKNGIYIITGCSHSGICNIIEHAKKITGDSRIMGVLGGFHLFDIDNRLYETIKYFVHNNIPHLYPCHCVSFQAKAEIHKAIKINEVGVGLTLSW